MATLKDAHKAELADFDRVLKAELKRYKLAQYVEWVKVNSWQGKCVGKRPVKFSTKVDVGGMVLPNRLSRKSAHTHTKEKDADTFIRTDTVTGKRGTPVMWGTDGVGSSGVPKEDDYVRSILSRAVCLAIHESMEKTAVLHGRQVTEDDNYDVQYLPYLNYWEDTLLWPHDGTQSVKVKVTWHDKAFDPGVVF